MTYEFHPFANVFPLLDGDDLGTLTEDIRENGQREPVILYDGKILDGRNRYRACVELGIPAIFDHSKASNDEEALRESVSRNLRRRHLTPTQRALAGARLLPMFEEIAREKLVHCGLNYGAKPGIDYRTNQKPGAPVPQASDERDPRARDQAAAAVGAGARSVQSAKKVLNDAPDLVPALEAGHIQVFQAAKLAKEDRETRDAVMSLVTSGEEKSVSEAVQRVKGGVPKALLMSESNEWYTPDQYVDAARYLMGGIDLDPASCEQANETVRAEVFYTKDDDGFSKAWSGRVWMNPPYGKEDGESNQSRWTKRLIDSYENGEILSAVFIVNAATSASWFQRFWDYPICFVRRRISFVSPSGEKNSPTQGNVFVYLGEDIEGFVDNFSPFGRIVINISSLDNISVSKGD